MDTYRLRGNIIIGMMGLLLLVLILRLFDIQIVNSEYRGMADKRVKAQKVIIPPRGNIFNRHGEIYVKNSPLFDLRVTPTKLYIPDTFILARHLELEEKEIEKRLITARKGYNKYKESILAQYIEPSQYSILQEVTWNFEGIDFNMTNKRSYVYPVGANFLGYIGEVDSSDIKNAPPGTYSVGAMIGKSGIERSYDSLLRGVPGQQIILKDVFGREVDAFQGGRHDRSAIKGNDILLGIDTELQKLGEELMQNKRGSIVAIEPFTGEILAFISSPTYDPDELTGQDFIKNWKRLRRDTLNPLYNRPLMATYAPGSIFKIPLALAALNEGIINPETVYSCGGGFWRNKGKPGCRLHPHPLTLKNAVSYSCNSYFAATFMDFLNHRKFDDLYKGYQSFYDYMYQMGIGHKLGVDIPYEQAGNLPSANMYDNPNRWYGKNRWNALTVISNSIGQGELLMTPLQMANLAASIANKGEYVVPHFVIGTKSENDSSWRPKVYPKVEIDIEKKHYETMINAMEIAARFGTASRSYIDPSIPVCGKTGTAENPHGEDHSIFMGFAPRQNPQIAIGVIIENAGGGGTWAAPIGGIMMEQFIKKEVISKAYEKERISKADFLRYW